MWEYLRNIARTSNTLPGVDRITVLRDEADLLIQEWKICVGGAPFSWVEKVSADSRRMVVTFEAIDGDFDVFKGNRVLHINEDNTLVFTTTVTYTLGIPVIEENFGAILKLKLQSFIDALAAAIGSQMSMGCCDARAAPRVEINRRALIKRGASTITADVLDICPGGMAFRISEGMLPFDNNREIALEIAGLPVRGTVVYSDGDGAHRCIFTPGQKHLPLQDALLKLPPLKTADILVCEVVTTKPVLEKV